MRAASLSVCVPYQGCNKNCPYCVSKMTGLPDDDETDLVPHFIQKLSKAKYMAQATAVSNVLITGKGEPLLNMDIVRMISSVFRGMPLEIQTNGILLADDPLVIPNLALYGLDTVAISVDSIEQIENLADVIARLNEYHLTVRLSINLLDRITTKITPREIILECRDLGVHQVSFRQVTIPTHKIMLTKESFDAQLWIMDNVTTENERKFFLNYKNLLDELGIYVKKLPFGAFIHMVYGVSCTHLDNCIQEVSASDDIRSLIYWPDGHMSTSWYGSNYGRLF